MMKHIVVILFALFVLAGIGSAQTTISTTGDPGAVGCEVVVDDFGHIISKTSGTTAGDFFNTVQWIDYSSKFMQVNWEPLIEIKAGTAGLQLFDGFPAAPAGAPNGYFFPDRYDSKNWTLTAGSNENRWHTIVEYEANGVHIIGGLGYKIDDPGQLVGYPWVDVIPASQFTNVGDDPVVLRPYHYERIAQLGGAIYANGDMVNFEHVTDYDGLIGTSDDYVASNSGLSALSHLTFAGFPINSYRLNPSADDYLHTLQNSFVAFAMDPLSDPVAGGSEISFEFEHLTLDPGQTALYWFYPKVIKLWNKAGNFTNEIDYNTVYVDEPGIEQFMAADARIEFTLLDFVQNAQTGEFADTMQVTVAEIFGGMIESEIPEGIGEVLTNRYWEVIYDVRNVNTVANYTFKYDLVDDGVTHEDSLVLLYRTDYDMPWMIHEDVVIDDVTKRLTANHVNVGTSQWVIAQKEILIPGIAELISPKNNSLDMWFNPSLEWIGTMPSSYRVEVADNEAFNNPVIAHELNLDSEDGIYQILNDDMLQDDVTYYWRVQAFTEFGDAEWSEVWNFTTSDLNWTVLPEILDNGNPMGATATYFHSPDTGWVTGGDTKYTHDGGLTWTHTTNLAGVIFNDIIFTDDETEFVVGSSGEIRTFDGVMWNHVENPLDNGWYKDIDFPTTNVGYIAGELATAGTDDPALLKTIDGGQTWVELNSPLQTDFDCVSFINEQIGFVGGINNSLMKTEDGGATWDIIDLGLAADHTIHDVKMTTINHIHVVGSHGLVMTSYDGGQTWNRMEDFDNVPAVRNATFYSIYFISPGNGFIVGDKTNNYQVVLRTDNSGFHWGLQNSNVLDNHINPAGLENVFFTGTTGYAVGYHGTAIKYNFDADLPAEPVADVVVPEFTAEPSSDIDVPIGVALGEETAINAFEMEIAGFGNKLVVLDVSVDNTLTGDADWLVEYNVTPEGLKIAAAGTQEIQGTGNLFKVRFYVSGQAENEFVPIVPQNMIFNTGEVVVNTQPGGVNVQTDIMYGDANSDGFVQAFDASHILKYLAGEIPANLLDSTAADVSLDGSISSLDGSLILQYIVDSIDTLPYTGTNQFVAEGSFNMTETEVASGAAVVDVPVFIESGANIYAFLSHFTFDSEKMIFTEVVEWAEGLDKIATNVHSADGKLILTGASTSATEVEGAFVTLRFEILDGFGEEAVLTLSKLRLNENETQSDVANSLIRVITDLDETAIPTDFAMDQNYPNPFNPSTRINFSLPVESKVIMTLYNTLGQKVRTIISSTYSAGYHEVTLNASDLSSGMYIYTISATGNDGKNFTSSKKLLLMK